MLDAPVSGGEPKAIDGTLSIMVGGDRAVFDDVEPILAAMGSAVVHVGEIGAGNIAKLANQVVVAVNIAAVVRGAGPVPEGRRLARRPCSRPSGAAWPAAPCSRPRRR